MRCASFQNHIPEMERVSAENSVWVNQAVLCSAFLLKDRNIKDQLWELV